MCEEKLRNATKGKTTLIISPINFIEHVYIIIIKVYIELLSILEKPKYK